MAELKLKLNVDDKAAIAKLKNIEKYLEQLKKTFEGLGGGKPSGAGGSGSTPKPPNVPKPDLSALKAYKAEAQIASVTTTRLGRELDALGKAYGYNSDQVKNFAQQQLKDNVVRKQNILALTKLKQAYKDGAIGVSDYKLAVQKAINTQQLFKNKMNQVPKPDLSAFKAYKAEAQIASVTTTRLGRELDALGKAYGYNSDQVKNFAQQQLKDNVVRKQNILALTKLKQAYKDGAIGVSDYKLAVQKAINTQQLFKNKMNMATPIRQMQLDFKSIGSLIAELASGNIGAFGSLAEQAFQVDKLRAYRDELAGVGTASNNAVGGFSNLVSVITLTATAIGAVIVGLAGIKIGFDAIKTGREFEDMEFQMTALINASTKFKDSSGNFVDANTNLEMSLNQSKALIKQFVKDAPALAGTNLKELTETAAISVGQLINSGVTKAFDQAKIIEGLTVAVKTITRGQANQLGSEIRGVINEDFRKNNLLINQIADKLGGKKTFQRLANEARQAGTYGEFLTEQMEPFIKAANFASNSLSNVFEIITDIKNAFDRTISDSGLLESAKAFPKAVLGAFVELEDPARFGKVKDNFLQLGREIGISLSQLVNAFLPLAPVLSNLFIEFLKLIPSVITPLAGFINVLTSAIGAINGFLSSNDVLVASIKGLITAFVAMQAASMVWGWLVGLPALIGTAITSVGGLTAGIKALNIAMFANPASIFIGLLIAIGAAFIALTPKIEDLQKKIEESMSSNVQAVLEGSNDMRGILDELAEGNALTVQQINQIWDTGLLAWHEKTGIVLKSLVSDFQTTFSYLANVVEVFFLNLASKAAAASQNLMQKLAGSNNIAGKVIGSVGSMFFGQAKGQIDKRASDNQARIERQRAQLFNKNFSLGSKPVLPQGTGVSSYNKSEEEADKKGSKAAANKAAKEKERLENSIKSRQEAERELKIAEDLAALKNKELEVDQELFARREALKGYENLISEQENILDLEKQRVEKSFQQKKITEQQKNSLLYNIELKEIELRKEQDIIKAKERQISIDEARNKLTDIQNKTGSEIKGLETEIGVLEEQKLNAKTETEVNKLATEIAKLNAKLTQIKSDALAQVQDATQKVQSLETEQSLSTQKAQQDRQKEAEEARQAYSDGVEENNEKTKNALIEGGKEIFNSIRSAWQDGKITIEEVFGILDTILGKLGGIFKSGGQGGGFNLGGIAKGIGSLFGLGGGGKKDTQYDPSTLTRGADNVFSAFNKLTGVTENLNTKCQSAANSLVGLGGSAEGLGGLFGGAGGAGAAITAGISTAISVGTGIYSFFSSRKKAKKEAETKRKIEEINNIARVAFNEIEMMQRRLDERLQILKNNLEDVNREIRRIDVGTSLFFGEQVVQKTTKQIQMLIDEIGEGSDLKTFTSYFNAYWQGMSVLWVDVGGLNKKATGLYAERNKQIKALLAARDAIMRIDTSKNGEAEKAGLEQIDKINNQILEINDNFNSQIRDMTEQRKDLQEALEKAIETQKQNYIKWMDRVEKEKLNVQYGEIGGTLFDEMGDVVEQVREVLLSGIDPQMASFLVARIKEKATNDMKNQYRDFLEGVNDNYLRSIMEIQDELFAVISEGRVTGIIKKSNIDKRAEMQRKLDALQGEKVQSSAVKLEDFGLGLEEYTSALESMTDRLNQQIDFLLMNVQGGQYKATDTISINVVTPPEIIAEAVQKELKKQFATPALATAPRL